MTPTNSKAKKVLNRMVDTALCWAFIRPRTGKPGELVKRLTPEDREALKELTSDEIKNAGLPLYGK